MQDISHSQGTICNLKDKLNIIISKIKDNALKEHFLDFSDLDLLLYTGLHMKTVDVLRPQLRINHNHYYLNCRKYFCVQ